MNFGLIAKLDLCKIEKYHFESKQTGQRNLFMLNHMKFVGCMSSRIIGKIILLNSIH